MTRILLIRHGHVEGIAPPRFRGRTELPLTDLGMRQAVSTAARIRSEWNTDAVYTSPMGRCIRLAEVIADTCEAPWHTTPDLNDLDYGQWQWKPHDEVRARWPELYARWRNAPHLVRFPEGESLQDIVARSSNALREAIARHPSETVVFVAHDSVNRVLLLQLLDQPLSAYWRLAQDPCGISEIEVTDDNVRIVRINETAHLAGLNKS